jgi:hypothetical protein
MTEWDQLVLKIMMGVAIAAAAIMFFCLGVSLEEIFIIGARLTIVNSEELVYYGHTYKIVKEVIKKEEKVTPAPIIITIENTELESGNPWPMED